MGCDRNIGKCEPPTSFEVTTTTTRSVQSILVAGRQDEEVTVSRIKKGIIQENFMR